MDELKGEPFDLNRINLGGEKETRTNNPARPPEDLTHAFQELRRRIEELEQTTHEPDAFRDVIPATLSAGVFHELVALSGQLYSFASGQQGTVLASGVGCVIRLKDGNASNFRYVSVSGTGGSGTGTGGGNLKLVYLVKDGGSDGDGTTAASWTYSVYDDALHSILLGTTQAQLAPRVLPAVNTPADYGQAQVSAIGVYIQLVYAFESYPMDTCP